RPGEASEKPAHCADKGGSPIGFETHERRALAGRRPVVWSWPSIAGVFDPPREGCRFRKDGNTRSPRQGPKRQGDDAARQREAGSDRASEETPGAFTKRICAKARGERNCPMRLLASIPTRIPSGDGNSCFQPVASKYFDREAGIKRRHHVDESVIQKAIKVAVEAAGITKHGTAHSLRHSF